MASGPDLFFVPALRDAMGSSSLRMRSRTEGFVAMLYHSHDSPVPTVSRPATR